MDPHTHVGAPCTPRAHRNFATTRASVREQEHFIKSSFKVKTMDQLREALAQIADMQRDGLISPQEAVSLKGQEMQDHRRRRQVRRASVIMRRSKHSFIRVGLSILVRPYPRR